MTAQNLRTLWALVGTLLAFYALNALLANRGVTPIFDLQLIDDRPQIESLFALPICAVLLIVVARIGRLHARLQAATHWHERLPVVLLQGMNTASPEGRKYQIFFFAAFVGLPVYAIGHFFLQIMGADVRPAAGGPAFAPWQWVPPGHGLCDRYLFAQTEKGGVDWFPVFQPALFAALTLWALAEAASLTRAVFRKPAQPEQSR